jgi:multidrug resistance efflux pump
MSSIMGECEVSTEKLQQQVNEARERSQRELAELRRQLEEKGAELDKCRLTAKKLQEEVRPANPLNPHSAGRKWASTLPVERTPKLGWID